VIDPTLVGRLRVYRGSEEAERLMQEAADGLEYYVIGLAALARENSELENSLAYHVSPLKNIKKPRKGL
jgi:hypothetical protein